MKNFIKKRLLEALMPPSFRLPQEVKVSPEELQALKNVTWQQLDIEDLEGSGNIAHLKINFPFETQASNGIVVDIQMLQGAIYQVHIHLPSAIQGIGLAYKIYKKIIMEFGHLYSGKGRRMNPNVNKIWTKLHTDPDIECYDSQIGDLCMCKTNPDKEQLIKFLR